MDLSIVIPVYNSENILPVLVKEIENSLKKNNIENELILINDSSKDNSWNIIKELCQNKKFVKGINLKNNYGQHNAISAGLFYCKGNFVILMDDDLQHDPIYINQIFNELKNGYDACYVKYLRRKHITWKKIVSSLNHLSSSFLSNKSLKIYTSSFKGFNKKICKKINDDKDKEVFLDWIILEHSKNIQSIDVMHRKRFQGKTNYNLRKLLILWANMIIKIRPKNMIKKIIVLLIRFIIESFLFKFIKKKKYNEKFLVLEKTF